MTSLILLVALLVVSTATTTILAAASPTILRIRTIDGSVLRVPLDHKSTLSSILASVGIVDLDDNNNDDDETSPLKCQIGLPGRASCTTLDISPRGDCIDGQKTAKELGLKHGTMITILPPPMDNKKRNDGDDEEDQIDTNNVSDRFDPYPDIAKSTSYSAASRRARALSRGVSRGMTYGDISRIRSTMHTVEPQSKGPLTRVYVCQVGAARFQNHCIVNSPMKKMKKQKSSTRKKDEDEELSKVENRVALLFGTINKERVDQGKKKARTSLSSSRADEIMCEVGKVHAIWEPPMQKPTLNGKHYDEECLLSGYTTPTTDNGDSSSTKFKTKETATDRAIRVATYLGLQPIGWMFSYADDNRHEDGDALPVHGRDAVVGAKLQIETMKRIGRSEGCKFVTLALDGRVGACEAFQLSDVCVQMVAENALSPPVVDESLTSTRYMKLKDPAVVSGEETKKLDSVLLLVNTAMLSHVGLYSGGTDAPVTGNVKRGSGALLAKTRKRLLSAIEQGDNNMILKELCDFDILLALDTLIGSREESEKLCLLVRKYARGQKKGTVLDDHLKLVLQSALGG